MAKKNKQHKETPTTDPRVTALQSVYDNGNFSEVRHQALALQNDETLAEKDAATAKALHETVQIDQMALVVGLGTLSFISLIAFLSLSAG